VAWFSIAQEAFDASRESLDKIALLEHPRTNAEIALFKDQFKVSDQSIRAALQQQGDNGWEPLAFFSKKLSPAESKCSAFDRELLAIYFAIKHFQYMLEARTFTIYTDYKPLTSAF